MASTITAPPPAPDARAAAAANRYLVFGVGARLYGCEIDVVREIVPFRRCTRLPGAPAYVCGLINLRGTVITVIDLGLRLGDAPVDRHEGSVILVEHAGRLVGLGVDEMRDVQRLAASEVEVTGGEGGDAAHGSGGGAVRGIARVAAGVVVLLDAAPIIRQALL